MVKMKIALSGGCCGLVTAVAIALASGEAQHISVQQSKANQVPMFEFVKPQINNNILALFKTDIEALNNNREAKKAEVEKPPIPQPQPKPEKTFGLKAEQEAAQSGAVNKVFNKENTLTLKGVFNAGDAFAVVAITNLRTTKVDIKKYKQGDEVLDYKVTKITSKSIHLQKQSQKIELLLFTSGLK
jgi:hypothetical protein